jgi:hypothetical protein
MVGACSICRGVGGRSNVLVEMPVYKGETLKT